MENIKAKTILRVFLFSEIGLFFMILVILGSAGLAEDNNVVFGTFALVTGLNILAILKFDIWFFLWDSKTKPHELEELERRK